MSVLDIRLTVEQLSLIDIAIDTYSYELMMRKQDAVRLNDTTVRISELDRRIKVLRKARRIIQESLDV